MKKNKDKLVRLGYRTRIKMDVNAVSWMLHGRRWNDLLDTFTDVATTLTFQTFSLVKHLACFTNERVKG